MFTCIPNNTVISFEQVFQYICPYILYLSMCIQNKFWIFSLIYVHKCKRGEGHTFVHWWGHSRSQHSWAKGWLESKGREMRHYQEVQVLAYHDPTSRSAPDIIELKIQALVIKTSLSARSFLVSSSPNSPLKKYDSPPESLFKSSLVIQFFFSLTIQQVCSKAQTLTHQTRTSSRQLSS